MHCKGKKNSFGGRKSSFKAHQGFKHVPLNDPDGTRGGSPNNPSLMNPNQMAQNRMLNSAVNASSSSQGTGGTGDNRTLAGAALGLGGAYLLYKGIKGLAGKIKESPRFQGSLLGTSNEPRLAAKAERNKLRQENRNRRFGRNKDGSPKKGFVQMPDGSIEKKIDAPLQKIQKLPVKPIKIDTPKPEMQKAELTKNRKADKASKKSDKMMEKDIKKTDKLLQQIDDYDEGKGPLARRRRRQERKKKKNQKQNLKDAGIFKSKKRYDKLKKKADKGNKKAQQQISMLDPETGKPPTFGGGNRAEFAAGALLTAAAPMLKKAAVSAVANVAAKKLMPEKEAAKGFKTIINNLPSGSSNRK